LLLFTAGSYICTVLVTFCHCQHVTFWLFSLKLLNQVKPNFAGRMFV